ncbi:MAG: transposase [Sphaerospermopsis sp. SIO1G2]|nr:transposase [Sphaerospermopsis sp. SIO1G2]
MEKLLLRKRGIIETVIEQLKNICHIDHTKHCSPDNCVANLIAGLTAYFFKPRRPKIDTLQLTFLTLLTSK